jgi:hypothetical protein
MSECADSWPHGRSGAPTYRAHQRPWLPNRSGEVVARRAGLSVGIRCQRRFATSGSSGVPPSRLWAGEITRRARLPSYRRSSSGHGQRAGFRQWMSGTSRRRGDRTSPAPRGVGLRRWRSEGEDGRDGIGGPDRVRAGGTGSGQAEPGQGRRNRVRAGGTGSGQVRSVDLWVGELAGQLGTSPVGWRIRGGQARGGIQLASWG